MQQRERYMELPKNVFDVISLNMPNIWHNICTVTALSEQSHLHCIFTGVFNLNALC